MLELAWPCAGLCSIRTFVTKFTVLLGVSWSEAADTPLPLHTDAVQRGFLLCKWPGAWGMGSSNFWLVPRHQCGHGHVAVVSSCFILPTPLSSHGSTQDNCPDCLTPVTPRPWGVFCCLFTAPGVGCTQTKALFGCPWVVTLLPVLQLIV